MRILYNQARRILVVDEMTPDDVVSIIVKPDGSLHLLIGPDDDGGEDEPEPEPCPWEPRFAGKN
jgi:hypothetical protein